VLRALVAGLGSAEEVVVADCLRGLHALAADPTGGSEVLAQRMLEAGIAQHLNGLWARLLPQNEGEGPSEPNLSPPAMALAMALCANLVRLPGLAAALVAFEAPATLAAAALGYFDACKVGAAAASPALAVLRACARELGGGSATPKTHARVGLLAQVAFCLLGGLGWLSAGAPTGAAGRVEAAAALADVLACAPAELVGAIAWTDAVPKR
jgi:hypothetical protein